MADSKATTTEEERQVLRELYIAMRNSLIPKKGGDLAIRSIDHLEAVVAENARLSASLLLILQDAAAAKHRAEYPGGQQTNGHPPALTGISRRGYDFIEQTCVDVGVKLEEI